MKINRKQFQELMLLATGFRISLDFEGYYILNYSGLHLYRCSETIILMNNGNTSDTVKIEFIDADTGKAFRTARIMEVE